MGKFELHPRLESDTLHLLDLPLSRLLLMNDARFPWCILVPQRSGLREMHELTQSEAALLHEEIRRVSLALSACVHVDKLNVAALGNQVPQLHVHVIARRHDDAAWPQPVWGLGSAEPYDETASRTLVTALRAALEPH